MAKKKKAVALKYNLEQDLAPVVIASGYGEVAERIINIAEERGIPVYRDDSTASMLCMLEVGASIPEDLYQVVATIYVQIMETANRIKEGTAVGATQPAIGATSGAARGLGGGTDAAASASGVRLVAGMDPGMDPGMDDTGAGVDGAGVGVGAVAADTGANSRQIASTRTLQPAEAEMLGLRTGAGAGAEDDR